MGIAFLISGLGSCWSACGLMNEYLRLFAVYWAFLVYFFVFVSVEF